MFTTHREWLAGRPTSNQVQTSEPRKVEVPNIPFSYISPMRNRLYSVALVDTQGFASMLTPLDNSLVLYTTPGKTHTQAASSGEKLD